MMQLEINQATLKLFQHQLNYRILLLAVYATFLRMSYAPFCHLNDMTRMNDFIFILCSSPFLSDFFVSIRIYEGTTPFDLLMLIHLEEIIKNPWYLASSAASECLYLTGFNSSCIWKIALEDHKVTKWRCDLKSPGPVTVSTDGQVVVLQEDQTYNKHILNIYGLDAVLIRTIDLSDDIYYPLRAILKPNGQFIVVHRINMTTRYINKTKFILAISLVTTNGQIINQVYVIKDVFMNSANDGICWSLISDAAEINDFDINNSERIRPFKFVSTMFLMLEEYVFDVAAFLKLYMKDFPYT